MVSLPSAGNGVSVLAGSLARALSLLRFVSVVAASRKPAWEVIACGCAASAIFPVTGWAGSDVCCVDSSTVWLCDWLSVTVWACVDLSAVAGVLSTEPALVVDAVEAELVDTASDAVLCIVRANALLSTESVGRSGNEVDGEDSDCGADAVVGAVPVGRVCDRAKLIAFTAAPFLTGSF
jgi:hypothetical protein